MILRILFSLAVYLLSYYLIPLALSLTFRQTIGIAVDESYTSSQLQLMVAIALTFWTYQRIGRKADEGHARQAEQNIATPGDPETLDVLAARLTTLETQCHALREKLAAAAQARSSEPHQAEALTAVAPVAADAQSMHPSTDEMNVAPALNTLDSRWEDGLRWVKNWIVEGNSAVRVGIIILFFGVAFLLKYASDNSLLPISFRVAGAAVFAVILLATGWRLRNRRGPFGLVLQGGGVGILYVTVFGATRLYDLISAQAALPLLILVCTLSAFIALRQNAQSLAFMGSAGGFMAPVLVASGGGNHIALFSYYALLNASVLAIAWHRVWPALNLLGFISTFVIGSAWGATRYEPALFASTEPFLLLFFLMYVSIPILQTTRGSYHHRKYLQSSLVFGTPIIVSFLQAQLVQPIPFGLAWSAVIMSVFYLLVTTYLYRRREKPTLLCETMLALSVIFATLAIPFAFSGPTLGASWALEGAAAVWLSVRLRRVTGVLFGLLMQIAAGAAMLFSWSISSGLPTQYFLNGEFIAMLMIAMAGLFSGWWLECRSDARHWFSWLSGAGKCMAGWGLSWWILGWTREILLSTATDGARLSDVNHVFLTCMVLLLVITVWLAHAARLALGWRLAAGVEWALTPLLGMAALATLLVGSAPTAGAGIFAWPIAIASMYAILRGLPTRGPAGRQSLAGQHCLWHVLSFWSVGVVLVLEGYWQLRNLVPEGAWSWSAWAYGVELTLLAVCTIGLRLTWPVRQYPRAYLLWGSKPLVGFLMLWSMASIVNDGNASPLAWLPLINPLDVAQLLALMAMAIRMQALREMGIVDPAQPLRLSWFAVLFLWANALVLRTLHHWGGVSYTWNGISGSTLAQVALTIFWTFSALTTQIIGNRLTNRRLWFIGGGWLVLTIIKLFLFDLSHVTGLGRIVSFIGVGLLLLLVGYFAPVPPTANTKAEQA